MQKNKKTKRVPFWLQIVAILAVGVLLSVAVLWFSHEKAQEAEQDVKESTPVVETHTVTFAYQDGTVIETKTVEDGKGVFPPTLEYETVFRGWSAGFNAVKSDIEVHPVFYNNKEENLFYFNSVYVKEGTAFDVDLYVGGNVSLSSGIITLEYDAEVLEYKKADSAVGVTVSENKKGVLTVVLDTEAPLKEKTRLSTVTFFAKEKDAYSTQMNLTAADVMLEMSAGEQPVTYTTINNKIYFLQEV